MTKLLYLEDFDVESCEARVTEVQESEGRPDVILDATCFYPRGGGQDWDEGKITCGESEFVVGEVRLDENGDVHHFGAYQKGELKSGDVVQCEINHDRRAINTRLHSAGHVIDMAVDALGLDWLATKGQHYPHLSAIEYQGLFDPGQTEEMRGKIETKVNELIAQNIENTIKFVSIEEMSRICRHVPPNIPTNKPARVVMYGDSFGVPCGGTHVRNLGDIGIVHIPKMKSKKGVIRINYTVEGIN